MTPHQSKKAMSLAIDKLLSAPERAELNAHLDQVPRDAQLWARMQRADRMLKNAPQQHAPSGFTERFADLLASGRQPRTDARYGLGIALGLAIVALAVIPLLSLAVIGLVVTLIDPQAQGVLLSQINTLLAMLTDLSVRITTGAGALTHNSPLTVIAGLSLMPLLILLTTLLRSAETDGHTVTYRIPVRVTA